MNSIRFESLEFAGIVVVTLALALQLSPLFRNVNNKEMENYPKSNSLGNSEKIFIGIKNNKWRLIGIAIIALSLAAGVIQKSILFGLSICATTNYLLSVVDRSYMENAAGSNRFIANMVVGFYSSITFVLMMFFWYFYSKFK